MESIARHVEDGSPACVTLLQRVAGAEYAELRDTVRQMPRWEYAQLNALANEILHDAREIALIDAYRHAA